MEINQQSQSAYKRVKKMKDENIILDLLDKHGELTLEEAARAMGKEKNQISGRFTNLKRTGEIEDSGKVRNHFTVYKRPNNQTRLIL